MLLTVVDVLNEAMRQFIYAFAHSSVVLIVICLLVLAIAVLTPWQ